jgi:hypothetical protein
MHHDRIRPTRIVRVAPWLLGATSLGAAAAHVLTSLGGHGLMALLMGGMGLLCLTCLPHLQATTQGIEKSALNLILMSGSMAVVHMLLIGLPGMEGHNHGGSAASASAPEAHGAVMLGMIGIELLALMVASAVLRVNRSAHASILPAFA